MRFPLSNRLQGYDISLHKRAECEEPVSPRDRVEFVEAFRRGAKATTRNSRRESARSIHAAIEAVVAPLRKEIAELKASIQDPIAPEPNDFEVWIQSEAVKKYAGQFIACTGPGVVVAHAKSDDELMDKISNLPNKNKLLIDRVPRA